MGVLRRVEIAGLADGSRSVRLRHAGGTCEGTYRDGLAPGEALLALGCGEPWTGLARALHERGVASLLLDPVCGDAGVEAGLAFLDQRGVSRTVLAAAGSLCGPALAAVRGSRLSGLALIDPDAACAGPGPAATALIAITVESELAARRVASSRLCRTEIVKVRSAGELGALLLTFVLDACAGGPVALAE